MDVALFIALSLILPHIHFPSTHHLYREEECESGLKEEEKEAKDEETPVTESDSDEQEGAVSQRTTPRYFRTCWSGDISNAILQCKTLAVLLCLNR